MPKATFVVQIKDDDGHWTSDEHYATLEDAGFTAEALCDTLHVETRVVKMKPIQIEHFYPEDYK